MPLQPFVGQIMPAAFGLVPKGWARCDGSLLAIQTNQALFALLGTTFGGDGRTTFGLPDLRGRAILGSDLASVPRGQISGTETVSISIGQMPNHNHIIGAATTTGSGRGSSPTGNLFGTATAPAEMIFAEAGSNEVVLAPATNVGNDGGNQPHNNMQPYLAINYVISLVGIFPPRP